MAIDQQQLLGFLNESFDLSDQLTPETELFSSGLLDSVMMLNLIMFIEEQEGTQVSQADVTLENFDSPQRIMTFVESLR